MSSIEQQCLSPAQGSWCGGYGVTSEIRLSLFSYLKPMGDFFHIAHTQPLWGVDVPSIGYDL